MSTIPRPLPFKIPKAFGSLYHLQEDRGNSFYSRLHYHPEIQITLIVQGSGTIISGDYLGEFKEMELYVIGSNVAHIFDSRRGEGSVFSISLFLDSEFFDSTIFDEEDRVRLERFTTDSIGGLRVKLNHKSELHSIMRALPGTGQGLSALSLILKCVDLLTTPDSYESLSTPDLVLAERRGESERINMIIQHTIEHYQNAISLDEVADIASLSKASFCRFFKQRTGKTYTDFLAGVRVNKACQLLHNRSETIGNICFECGFSNISHFNRKFKAIKGITPSTYRKNLLQSMENR